MSFLITTWQHITYSKNQDYTYIHQNIPSNSKSYRMLMLTINDLQIHCKSVVGSMVGYRLGSPKHCGRAGAEHWLAVACIHRTWLASPIETRRGPLEGEAQCPCGGQFVRPVYYIRTSGPHLPPQRNVNTYLCTPQIMPLCVLLDPPPLAGRIFQRFYSCLPGPPAALN